MWLLTTQYLSSSRLISCETKRWQRNARQSFLTFLGGLRKSSAVLNLILSVQLTARGDSVRGFISAVDLSLKAKGKTEKVFGSSRSKINSFLSGRMGGKKTSLLVWFYFMALGLWQQKALHTPAACSMWTAQTNAYRQIYTVNNTHTQTHTFGACFIVSFFYPCKTFTAGSAPPPCFSPFFSERSQRRVKCTQHSC